MRLLPGGSVCAVLAGLVGRRMLAMKQLPWSGWGTAWESVEMLLGEEESLTDPEAHKTPDGGFNGAVTVLN